MPIISSPLGNIRISSREGCLSELKFTDEETDGEILDQVLLSTVQQLEEYFAGERKTFDMPIGLGGTDFQRKVWLEVNKIPFGQTATYMKISQKLGKPGAIRAVGAAIGANPILVILPCHRVLGSDGSLTGYAGGLDRKKALLELEGHAFQTSLFE
ncbi:MAG: methylated-DNA--[protein]-cysteine S-methyltransferase [Algoriphagus sp.]|jgi:methylated-DNA-[protein]-cysteine S-methyltransferase|uniref:methylated-DNA--[protein]-cysteine S-methyltransferase n=1 Tax=Algoriphagus sp. TaxID=1872435 RepID=UPI0027228B19|nr:methylated-DNA--[protein]-cysteine S-methyltransferase [Algoriphagus sp.]MDO8966217.1 methylated-DNA--[protein]-cysteine S-methyltransferase [Algoriphagus sp.]MDP2041826.1 methylated-DNA--[protein]-cysteine S-methyltransferase [Algoriphagus sp.]MDP3198655.1 methylated-DNA--[protein]-cysteine S-methyltransferase [Algoriphagus sp.]MDP3472079.1 methylated-DNA--[protein]-cysteine S-methyltransferase [Algoriphagus sp.]